jgi:H+-transporting ATPase
MRMAATQVPQSEPSGDTTGESIGDLLVRLDTTRDGLSEEEAANRLGIYGPNAIVEHRTSPLLQFLGFFWGPIPWMIEVAAVLSAVVRHWPDLVIILILLVFNAVVGFWQEHQAANAVEALKEQLALESQVRRDGSWKTIDATGLVPGDVIRIRLGDIIPADVRLIDGDYLSVDQSALTGESLPVSKKKGDSAYSGSIAREGEMVAVVTETGADTFFGRTAALVETAQPASHFQAAVLRIGNYLIYISIGLAIVLLVVQLLRAASILSLVQFTLILVVAAIPVAMPAVLSVTMAVGAGSLAKMKAIVSRLESIEEMAGMDILCSDKTGTLTQNRLTVGELVPFGDVSEEQLALAAALASNPDNADDAIDQAVLGSVSDPSALNIYRRTRFLPFNPVDKRTQATLEGAGGAVFKTTKGAPQVIQELCELTGSAADSVTRSVDGLAAKGYRTLGVARSDDGDTWRFLGLVPLFDPPREDSADTIARAIDHGIDVKMVTGDNTAIAVQISDALGLGTGIEAVGDVFSGDGPSIDDAEAIEHADGFAEVFPQHKFGIVKALQSLGHIVGMTGDGVNDAPALKQADTGIAVSGATDAARAAADLILTEPGLSVIVRAVEEARRIFERMNSYAIYRITETIRIMVFVVLAMIVFNFYPITAIMIILLAFFNDVPIMTIAYDRTWLDPTPVRWEMRRVLTVSTVLGLFGVIQTFVILLVAREWLKLDDSQIQTLIFLKLAVAGHLTLFVTRTRQSLLARPHPAPVMLWSAIVTKVLATIVVAVGFLVTPISWGAIGIIWGYCLAWAFVADRVKLATYRHLDLAESHHRHFIRTLTQSMHPAGHLYGSRARRPDRRKTRSRQEPTDGSSSAG